ncbi:hypothetical protein M513_06011 [Trichuris suis]|uniref:SCP domain-containing protein n=1 Tax=Trichuris suis TaxID=68888 RepID=A0A085M7A1_9BILA|nr:hypothetical protein M513_06011 [Trichuris suis]
MMSLNSVGVFSCVLALISTALGQAGVPQPLRKEQQVIMMIKHNELRKNTDQINMQCLVTVDEEMISYAQKIAESCEKTLPSNAAYGIAMKISNKPNESMINDYISAARKAHANYDHVKNTCKGDKEACQIFKQAYWYEAHAIGCGRATCGNTTHLVCAYSYKQNEDSNPFISWKLENGACSMCSSEKPICDEEQKCCTLPEGAHIEDLPKSTENAIDETTPTPAPTPAPTNPEEPPPKPAEPVVTTPPPSLSETPGNLVAVELWWDEKEQKYYMATNKETINSMQQNKRRYVQIKVLGKVANAETYQCVHLKPIRQIEKSGAGKIHFVINEDRYQQLSTQGYEQKSIIGYAVEKRGLCGADYDITEYEHPRTGFFIQTDNSNDDEKKLLSSGYNKKGTSFYIWKR